MTPVPPPIIERIGDLTIVRDDVVPGGTKRRVLARQLEGATEAVYASPVYGYAQIALAHACADLGITATVFVAKRSRLHPRTTEAHAAGARIVQVKVGHLNVVQARAREYCDRTGATLVPFGVDTPAFRADIAALARAMPVDPPREVWTVAGSGTLTRALQDAWPSASFHAVQVGRPPNVGRARLHVAPERFEDDATEPPPFPSCSNYDAKAWRFLRRMAEPDALFWNVAR